MSRLDIEGYYFVAISLNMSVIITNQFCFFNNKCFPVKGLSSRYPSFHTTVSFPDWRSCHYLHSSWQVGQWGKLYIHSQGYW